MRVRVERGSDLGFVVGSRWVRFGMRMRFGLWELGVNGGFVRCFCLSRFGMGWKAVLWASAIPCGERCRTGLTVDDDDGKGIIGARFLRPLSERNTLFAADERG